MYIQTQTILTKYNSKMKVVHALDSKQMKLNVQRMINWLEDIPCKLLKPKNEMFEIYIDVFKTINI